MKRRMLTIFGLICSVLFGALCLAQSATLPASPNQGDALRVLQKTGEVYRNMRSALFEGTFTLEFSSKQFGDLKTEMPLVIAEVRPNKARFELKDAKFGAARVSDGHFLWYYQPRTNQYTQNAINAETPASSLRAYTAYDRIDEQVKSARFLREETLSVNGASVSCHVIEIVEAQNPNPDIISEQRLLWIGKENYLVLKDYSRAKLNATKPEAAQVINTLTQVISGAKVNQPVPDSLFVFVPPEGAKRVEKVD